MKNPNWTVEEMIIASAFADEREWPRSVSRGEAVFKLVDLLRSASYHPMNERLENFRSYSSVSQKIGNLARSHPKWKGTQGSRSSRAEKPVVEAFVTHPREMNMVAAELRAIVEAGKSQKGDARRVIAQLFPLRDERQAQLYKDGQLDVFAGLPAAR